VLIGDGAFASEANFAAAEENNIELVTTSLTGQLPPEIVSDFQISDNIIIACPAGHAPAESKYNSKNDTMKADFDKDTCTNCPHREDCPVKIFKKKAVVTLSVIAL
jgi:hypothetical protein